MLSLLALINLGSFACFVIGLINPKKVLIGQNRTRLKSSKLYFAIWLTSFAIIGTSARQTQETVVQSQPAPTIKPSATSAPTPTPKVSPTPTPALVEATPTPIVENSAAAFDPGVCNTPAYLPVSGANTALYTVCQLIQTDSIKPESVSLINASDLEDWVAEAGYEKHTWQELSTVLDNKTDACVVYKDESISCLKFSKN